WRMFGARLCHQDFTAAAVAHVAPHSAVKALAVVPKDIERPAFSTTARRWLRHRSHAAAVQNSSFNPNCMMRGFMIITSGEVSIVSRAIHAQTADAASDSP